MIHSSICGPIHGPVHSSILGHFPLFSQKFPNSFIQGWNEPINMNGIIYLNQILG